MMTPSKPLWRRGASLLLVALLLLTPAAQAITPDQTKELLEEFYLNEVPQAALEGETVEDILQALNDPYTMYLSPEDFQSLMDSMADTVVVGIGISCIADQGGLLVVGTYEGSSARELGLVAGDIITQVEGKDAAGQPAEIVSGWLRGEEGTTVTFLVRHEDDSTQEYTATRSKVVVPIASTQLLEDGHTALISCDSFGMDALTHVSQGIAAYDDANLWLVDLRNNSGGDVMAVTQVLGLFLGEGTMVYLRDSQNEYYRYVSEQESATIFPVITLVSEYTASAAEIFALGVKDQHGGIVIGSNTFGKGVAQVLLSKEQYPEIFPEGDGMRITSYQFYGTGGNTANGIGVVPDLMVNPNHADEIAQLFSSLEPVDGQDYLQLVLGQFWWYIDLARATTPENLPYFTELLEALPPSCDLTLVTADGEESLSHQALADRYGLTDYTPRRFADVTGTQWEEAVNTLATYAVVNGFDDGLFHPDNSLTRGEMAALLVQALNLRAAENRTPFEDVSPEDWYDPYIQAAVQAGYMEGVGYGYFDPTGTLTHEQMFTIWGRVSPKLNSFFFNADKAQPEDYTPPEGYSDWAGHWVWLLSASQKNYRGDVLNLLYDEPEAIAPQAEATRGETAQVLYNLLYATCILNY